MGKATPLRKGCLLTEPEREFKSLKEATGDDTYYPPPRPRGVKRQEWRTEYPEEFPVALRYIGDEDGDDAA